MKLPCSKCFWFKRLFCVFACPEIEEILKEMETEYEKNHPSPY